MQIKTRLTLLFTLIAATILLIFAAVIYYAAKESREREFYALLQKEAYTKVNLFLDAQVDKNTLQEIYHNNRKILNEVEVAIYSTDYNLLYHDAVDLDFVKETEKMLQEIRKKGKIEFYQDNWQVIGIVYPYRGQDFIVTAAAYDQYGYNKLEHLLQTMVVVFIFSMVIIYLAGRLFSTRVFAPINSMTEKARRISATNLDLRLASNHTKDELSLLADTFNDMLDRLENSFDAQKSFVSHISHELRTPLAAIIAELELAGNKERTTTEYKHVINNTLSDAQKLVRLSNSLLDFAKASYDPTEIAFRPVRVDELLLDARQQVQQAEKTYKIDIHFSEDIEDENHISVNGNEYLLKVAFINLFENGCKFSPLRQSTVHVAFDAQDIILHFSDQGIGIPAEDLENIFLPFYRGENRQFADGNGIGLPLTKRLFYYTKASCPYNRSHRKGPALPFGFPISNSF